MFLPNDTVLEVNKVSKIYSRSRAVTQQRLRGTLSRALLGRALGEVSAHLRHGEFRALSDVSFSLKRGGALGIIGLNGSGKTTLLRMLAGQILPDGGQITVVGKTASMIDLTAGFQQGASGRENIFLRGAALGRTRAQMEADYDSIVEFAELDDAIAAPVATYSSGMTMRLAFSIIASAAPDLLFVDEVLAVGDFKFRQKCLARMRELRERSAFVMVSHSMTDIMRFCDEVIVLNKGQVSFKGKSDKAVEFYLSEIDKASAPAPRNSLAKVTGPVFENNDAVTNVRGYWSDKDGNEITEIRQGSELFFNVIFVCSIPTRNLIIGIPVWSQDGTYVTGFSTDQNFGAIRAGLGGKISIRLVVPSLHLNAGIYHSNLAIVDGSEFLWRKPNNPLTVLPKVNPQWGAVTIPNRWELV